MSRNLRNRPPVTPPKKEARRGSKSTDSSSDDDYDAVDLISDTEEDEPDVEVAEEEAIIASEAEAYDDVDAVQSSPRPSVEDDDEGSWAGFDLDDPDQVLHGSAPSFEDQMAQLNASESEEVDIYGDFAGFFSEGFRSPSIGRRVRFDLSDSSSTRSDSFDSVFPDIFLDQNSLAPSFRRHIERESDHDDDAASTSDEDEASGSEDNGADVMELFDDASSESSGYETDEGETTEEDLPTLIRGTEVFRSPRSAASSADEEITPTRRREEPRLADWTHDASKPFVVLDSRIKKLIVFGPRIARRYSYNFDISSLPQAFQGTAMTTQDEHSSPMIGDSAGLMLSALMRPWGYSNGAALGPPEAFYPYVGAEVANGATAGSPSTLDTDDDDELDDEMLWKVEDFIDFNNESSDESDGEQTAATDFEYSSTIEPSSTPARPTSFRSEDQVPHLVAQRGLVGAFRKAQDRHQLLARNVVSSESLAFSGPYRQGTLRGIRGDRLAAANTPITPMRKEKTLSATAPLSLSPESPLAAAMPNKRKFSGEQSGHKRSRSMI